MKPNTHTAHPVAIPIRHKGATVFALVDPADAVRVSSHRWHVTPATRRRQDGTLVQTLVPRREVTAKGRRRKVWLARVLMDAKRGEKVMNLDGNGLNCTRGNLRVKRRESA